MIVGIGIHINIGHSITLSISKHQINRLDRIRMDKKKKTKQEKDEIAKNME